MRNMHFFKIQRDEGRLRIALHQSDHERLVELASSRGLAFGQGLFETILVQGEYRVLERQHLARMAKGAQSIGIEFDQDLVQKAISNFLLSRTESVGILKVTLMAAPQADGAPRGYGQLQVSSGILMLFYAPGDVLTQSNQALSAIRVPEPLHAVPSALLGLKMTSSPQYVHWASWALKQGFDQGILFDVEGALIESTTSNIVLYDEHGVWVTPTLLASGVHGVMRQYLLEENIIHERSNVTEADVMRSRRVYLINSVRGCQWVQQYQGNSGSHVWKTSDNEGQDSRNHQDDTESCAWFEFEASVRKIRAESDMKSG